MMESRNESVIIYANTADIKNLPITVISSSSPLSSPIYYVDSGFVNTSNVLTLDSVGDKHQTDSSESSNNMYDVGSSIQLSPISDDCSENHHLSNLNHRNKLKRGRPKLETISNLINSSHDVSAIKCEICKRTFPREKSLQAHIRIHTGERPYHCDFPNCGRKFAQSGQLRTHQRLHTGEKPFVCNYEGCENRFTHANRRCPEHPRVGVTRDREAPSVLRSLSSLSNTSQEIVDWLKEYYKSQKRQGIKRSQDLPNRPFKARKLDMDAYVNDHIGTDKESREDNALPVWKKKRAALQLQAKLEVKHSEPEHDIKDESDDELSKDKLLGALALIELAKCPVIDGNFFNYIVKNEPLDSLNGSYCETVSYSENFPSSPASININND